MVCSKCGSEIEGEGTFCPYCGAPLQEREPRRHSAWEAMLPCLLAAAMVVGALCWGWRMR